MLIRQLTPEDAAVYLEHRQQALGNEPLAFLSSPQDDRASSVEAVRELLSRAPDSVILGACDGDLVGSIGIHREPKVKAAHNAHIWGMYVSPDHRRRGVARALLLAALDHARSQPAWSRCTSVSPTKLARRGGSTRAWASVAGARNLGTSVRPDGISIAITWSWPSTIQPASPRAPPMGRRGSSLRTHRELRSGDSRTLPARPYNGVQRDAEDPLISSGHRSLEHRGAPVLLRSLGCFASRCGDGSRIHDHAPCPGRCPSPLLGRGRSSERYILRRHW